MSVPNATGRETMDPAGRLEDVQLDVDKLSTNAKTATTSGKEQLPCFGAAPKSTAKVVRTQTYAAELQCSEADTRHWINRWCMEKNDGQLAYMPPILIGTGLEPTVPNVFKTAAKKHRSNR